MADYIHPEQRNIAESLDEEELTEIGQEAYELYETDLESRQEWEQRCAEWLRLYSQKDKPKNPPWEGASSESIPMLAEGVTQFAARAYSHMFDRKQIIRGMPTGKMTPESLERSKRVGMHMHWQLTVLDEDYLENKDRLLTGVALYGSYFTKTYRVQGKNMVKNVRPFDLIVPYGTGPRNLEDIDRKTEVIYMTEPRAKVLAKSGFFVAEPEPVQFDDKSEVDTAHDQVHGFQDSPMERNICKLLEQHTFLDLDDDGIPEPYIVTIDSESKQVLRIVIRYDTDEIGNPTDGKNPIEYYTHYTYMPNPDGFYGHGLGHLVAELNISVNKLVRQYVDSGTLANVGNKSGFISDQLSGVQGGELQMQLGKFVKVPISAEELNKGIYTFKFPSADPSVAQVIELMSSRSDRLASVTEAVTGQTEKVHQPTALASLIDQSLKVYSAVNSRLIRAWGRELRKVYRLNGKYMDPEEYFAVLDVDGSVREFHTAREDYAPDMKVVPTADPKMITEQQQLSKAEIEWQFLSMNPLVQSSPQHFYNASKRFLEAIESDSVDEVLPNPMGQQLPRVDNPHQENFGAMSPMPMVPPAFPGQDHQMHVQVHQELMNRDPGLSELGRAALEEHIRQHIMLAYGEQGGAVGAEGVVNGQANGMGAGAPGAEVSPGMVGGGLGQAQPPTGPAGSNGLPPGAA